MKTVNLTINGKAVTVPANYTILDAAKPWENSCTVSATNAAIALKT